MLVIKSKNIVKTLMDSSFNLLLMIDQAKSVPSELRRVKT
ncbi:hypothetical protein CSU_1725 [Campylobacter jejuni subsp. jejuni 327]|nr:hypothetical protein CJD42_7180 [Campylobacter jejuni subsp. jejuni D42a]EAQ57353.1 conserved hypothetical protein [Campylobacter jejuni subsp. jejuni CF93-6]EAQ95445.1 hypothetical protein CJJ8425_1545 [Campylobacter jejuni subsp. jejuni 84-25]EFV06746.1 hypothetical protein CSQ_1101 [Campylobacter jejuni subsp. jejuni DFVF1099]EFV08242.1 hypothetical protein CSS_1777 [Campylobacter jejuni subsp. jejuni 305]EFV09946.1 hypothetical protein CSU_1725 [Campylobacter jejuni subsp. jejuni 327]K